MYMIKLFRTNEGDLSNHPDIPWNDTLDEAKVATKAGLLDYFERDKRAEQKPTMARIYDTGRGSPYTLVAAFRCGPMGVSEMPIEPPSDGLLTPHVG